MVSDEILYGAGGFVAAVLAALYGYVKRPKPSLQDPVIAGIAMGFGDRQQIAVLERIAVALEILADRRTEELEDMHKVLLERLDAKERREEQEEQRPRRSPPRRR